MSTTFLVAILLRRDARVERYKSYRAVELWALDNRGDVNTISDDQSDRRRSSLSTPTVEINFVPSDSNHREDTFRSRLPLTPPEA
jgi:hypothetical protein